VNWVLDLDIRGFFDSIVHGWLVKFIEHRIADRRVVRLIQKWLNAGVLEGGERARIEEGTPKGSSISPLLDNVYLHHALDLWARAWCPMEVSRLAAETRKRRGEGKPETFDLLGFVHICGRKRNDGRFTVLRQTMRKRSQAKLSEVKVELTGRMHTPIPEQGKWLSAVVGGHFRYYAVPIGPALRLFRFQVGWLWYRALSRRSQNGHLKWDRMSRLIARWLVVTRNHHPYPPHRLGVFT
jgi:RNA-directed DNA polymerase